jgi:hypothetical protein
MRLARIIPRLVLFLSVALAGCSGFVGEDRPGTATTQADHAVRLATQIGQSLQVTRETGNQQATATAFTRQAQLEEAGKWQILLFDTFDENRFGWFTGEQEDPALASMTWSIDSGKYRWQGKANSGFVWWVTPESEAVTDFYLSASIQQTSQPGLGEYGLVFRQSSDEDYYLFEVNGSNQYALYLHSADGWEILIDWTPHPAISTGSPNRLEVVAKGAYFAFSINDEFVAEYSDERLSQGAVGLLVGLSNPGEEATWEFDDFMLRVP